MAKRPILSPAAVSPGRKAAQRLSFPMLAAAAAAVAVVAVVVGMLVAANIVVACEEAERTVTG